MNATYIHLLLNHFPIIGSMIGSALLLWGIVKKQQNLQYVSLVIIVIMAALSIPVFLTGEPAEEAVEHLPGVSEQMMELHEEAAELAMVLMGITGILALISLVVFYVKNNLFNKLVLITILAALLSTVAMIRTGYYGGRIRHIEISNGTAGATGDAAEKGGIEKEGNEEKDDD